MFREYAMAICTAVSILEAIASLGTRWVNVPVIANEFTKFQFFQRKMLISDVLISFQSNLLVVYVIESWNAGKNGLIFLV